MMIISNARRISMAVALLLLCFAAKAQSYSVTVPSRVDATAGGQVVLPVSVANAVVITGLEFTLDLPQGCTIEQVKAVKDRTFATTSLKFDATTGIVVLTDMDGLLAGEGELLNVTINVGGSTAGGEQDIVFRDIKFVDQALTKTTHSDVSTVLNVTTTEVESIQLNETSLKMLVGQRAELSVVFTPADTKDTRVKWTSSDASVATVNAGGVVSAIASGTAVITATTVAGGQTAQCAVQVNEAVSGFELTASPVEAGDCMDFFLTFGMKNQMELRGMSCDITLPYEFTPATDARGAMVFDQAERANSDVADVVSAYNADTRTVSISLYVTGNENIAGTTGDLLSWKVKQLPGTPLGDYTVRISNIKYVCFKSNGKEVSGTCEDKDVNVNVFQMGDVDKDGIVSLDDALEVLNHIVNHTTIDSNFTRRADMNGDGKITIVDATAIITKSAAAQP